MTGQIDLEDAIAVTYNAADNSAKCYNLAVHELRLQGLRDGKFTPHDLPEELIASGKATDYRHVGPHTLYQGDCMAIMPMLGKVDAVVTDPPYGLGKRLSGGTWGAKFSGGLKWDQEAACTRDLLALDVPTIVWGGNYMVLPPSRCWLVWRKPDSVRTMADAELAWTNLDANTRCLSHTIAATNAERVGHETQKPVAVMKWCLEFVPNAATILDPFMGSGTTGVACEKLGRRFIGIEINPGYFAIACRRLEAAMQQPDLFIQTAEKQIQEAFAL